MPIVIDRFRVYFILVLGFIGALLSSCQTILTPRIVLWHSWQGEQAQVIESAVERFSEIFDDVVVVASYVPVEDIVDRYKEVSPQGLGPDLFIGPSEELSQLAGENLIMPLPGDTLNPTTYYTSSIAALTYQDQLYGVPFAMRPMAMYYNRRLVETPATTLSELLAQAEAGIGVAINTQFSRVIWGIQSFGGRLTNDAGQVELNQGALTNWLNWLVTANANPQIFLSRDTPTLQDLFISGRVGYYTGSASELSYLRSVMDADNLGVVPLPSGSNGTSGPLMQVDALMFNVASSQIGSQKAIDLALFLTNLEQSTVFMRDLELVPTNRRVRVDLRTYPAIAGFIAQTRNTVAIPNTPQLNRLIQLGDDILLRVLEGVIDPNVAVENLTNEMNLEFDTTTNQPFASCILSGELVLWHSWTGDAQVFLSSLINRLNSRCSQLEAKLVFIPSSDIVDAYIETFDNDNAPDIVLTSSADLQELVESDAVLALDREMMQSFSPISQSTVTLLGIPYGFPISLYSNVFYYNDEIISDPPVTTDELLVEASPAFSVSRNAQTMLWSLTAYNGIVVQDDQVTVDIEQLRIWLQWLEQVKAIDHIEVVANSFLRRNQFLQGESVYYVDSSLNLRELSEQMGEKLAVGLFPTGTSSYASPLVNSYALFVNPTSLDSDLAKQFAIQLTDATYQEEMVKQLGWIPANIIANQSVLGDPLLVTIDQIIQTGIVINYHADEILVETSRAIDRIFRGGQTADDITQDLYTRLQEIGGNG